MVEEPLPLPCWTASDGYVAFYRRYLPDAPPRAHVVCLHGIQSHGGWYDYSSQRLCRAGYAVWYMDRRGSGANVAERGDAPTLRRLLRDVKEFLAQVVPAGPTTPVFLCACSWGGKLATAFCRAYEDAVDGLILISPGFFPRVGLPFGIRCRIAFDRLVRPRKKYAIPLNDPVLFTASERWRQFIGNDPLALHEATARFLFHSAVLDLYLAGAPRWVRLPTLLLLASEDRIIDVGRTRRYVQNFASQDKTILEYEGAHHTLEFEPDPDRFINDLIAWLRKHERLVLRHRPGVRVETALAPAMGLSVC